MESENGNSYRKNSGDRPAADDRNGRGERSTTHSEETAVIESSESHLRSSSSSSSTASKDFLEVSKDFLEVNSGRETNSRTNVPKMSPTQSPPVQVMDRNGGYDPDRIPASVFERSKSDTPADWSSASNESLFSIHLGNNSFTMGDLMKDEIFKSGELLAFSPALASPMVQSNEKTADREKEEVETPEEVEKESMEKTGDHPAISCKSRASSNHSHRSANSTKSFSFPILTGDAAEAADTEAGEQNAQPAQATSEENQSQSSNRWFPCLPPCPWCCSSHSSCSCF